MIKLSELIKVPISVGDTVLGGKFKNKKIKVKSIGKNDKGDITINGKPMMKVRIIPKSSIDFPEGHDTLKEFINKPKIKKALQQLINKKILPKNYSTNSAKLQQFLANNPIVMTQLLKLLSEKLGPSDEKRIFLMLKIYGQSWGVNFGNILKGINRGKPGMIKKGLKEITILHNKIEKELQNLI